VPLRDSFREVFRLGEQSRIEFRPDFRLDFRCVPSEILLSHTHTSTYCNETVLSPTGRNETKRNERNETCETKPAKRNLRNETCETKHSKRNARNEPGKTNRVNPIEQMSGRRKRNETKRNETKRNETRCRMLLHPIKPWSLRQKERCQVAQPVKGTQTRPSLLTALMSLAVMSMHLCLMRGLDSDSNCLEKHDKKLRMRPGSGRDFYAKRPKASKREKRLEVQLRRPNDWKALSQRVSFIVRHRNCSKTKNAM